MKIKTINQIISVFRDAATRHYQLNGFGIGDNWEVGASEAKIHPVLWINPVSAIMPESEYSGYKTFEIQFEVRVFDLVNKDESNENEVLSDTIQILKDIISEFKGHPYYTNSEFTIVDDINFESFTEEFDEEVSGWVCELNLKTPVLDNWCGLPMTEITGFEFPGVDCDVVNASCPSYIEDITGTFPIIVTSGSGNTKNISIDTSSLTGDTFTTGATLTGDTISFNRNDLNNAYDVDLSPLLLWEESIGNDTIVNRGGNNSLSGVTSLAFGFGNTQEAGVFNVLFGFGNEITGTTVSTNLFGTQNKSFNSTASFISGVQNVNYGTTSNIMGVQNTIYNNTTGTTYNTIFGTQNTIHSTDNNYILGFQNNSYGDDNFITSSNSVISGDTNSIVGGRNHTIISGVTGSTILGCNNITATESDTVYACNIDVNNIISGGTNLSTIISNTDNFTTGATLIDNVAYFDTKNSLSAYTLDLSSLSTEDIYLTGTTFNNNILTATLNNNATIQTEINNFTGLTVNGILSAATISGGTLYGDGSNLTGIDASNILNTDNLTLLGNYTHNLDDNILSLTGGTLSLSASTSSSGVTLFSLNNNVDDLWGWRNNGDVYQGANSVWDLQGNDLLFKTSGGGVNKWGATDSSSTSQVYISEGNNNELLLIGQNNLGAAGFTLDTDVNNRWGRLRLYESGVLKTLIHSSSILPSYFINDVVVGHTSVVNGRIFSLDNRTGGDNGAAFGYNGTTHMNIITRSTGSYITMGTNASAGGGADIFISGLNTTPTWLDNGRGLIIGAKSKISSELISLQGHTTIVGESTAGGDTALEILDNTNAQLWNWRNNGDVYQGADSIHYLQGNDLTYNLGTAGLLKIVRDTGVVATLTALQFENNTGSFNSIGKILIDQGSQYATSLTNELIGTTTSYDTRIVLQSGQIDLTNERTGGATSNFRFRQKYNNQGNTNLYFEYDHRPSFGYIQSLSISGTYTASGYISIQTNLNYIIDFNNTNGFNVGIGTNASPSEKLHVVGNGKFEGSLELNNALKNLGYTESTAAPTTTELPADKNYSIHKDTSAGTVYLAYNDGGVIKTVTLT